MNVNFMVFKASVLFNFLCLNEQLNFCLICLFTNNTGTLILDFMGFVLCDLVGKTNVSKRVFLLATSFKK